MKLEQIKRKIERHKNIRSEIKSQIQQAEQCLTLYQTRYENISQALLFVQKIAQETQSALKYEISNLVTSALASVFDEPYQLQMNFEVKRGRTEVQLSFLRDGHSIKPMTASGVGAVDVASFALRISLWNLSGGKTRAIIFLDEPFRYLSKDMQDRACVLLKELNQKLGIQFIIISHEGDLIEGAEHVFNVKRIGKVSQVKGKYLESYRRRLEKRNPKAFNQRMKRRST